MGYSTEHTPSYLEQLFAKESERTARKVKSSIIPINPNDVYDVEVPFYYPQELDALSTISALTYGNNTNGYILRAANTLIAAYPSSRNDYGMVSDAIVHVPHTLPVLLCVGYEVDSRHLYLAAVRNNTRVLQVLLEWKTYDAIPVYVIHALVICENWLIINTILAKYPDMKNSINAILLHYNKEM